MQKNIENKHKIVTLCGSTRFKEQFFRLNEELTRLGFIVLMPGVFGHAGDSITPEEKQELDSLHLTKIALSDFIYVLNINDYIGESTQKEIEWAKSLDIPVIFWYNKENEIKGEIQ